MPAPQRPELARRGVRPDCIVVDPAAQGSWPRDRPRRDRVHAAAARRLCLLRPGQRSRATSPSCSRGAGYTLDTGAGLWTSSRRTPHVETVVLLSHKKADSYIHIDVEFGEGEGKIPVDSIAKRAEAYKPKEKVTYKMIKEYIEAKYGFKVHTAYIAEVKRNLGLPMYDAPNAVEELKQPRKHPTPEKVEAIKDALRYFAVI